MIAVSMYGVWNTEYGVTVIAVSMYGVWNTEYGIRSYGDIGCSSIFLLCV